MGMKLHCSKCEKVETDERKVHQILLTEIISPTPLLNLKEAKAALVEQGTPGAVRVEINHRVLLDLDDECLAKWLERAHPQPRPEKAPTSPATAGSPR